jgi:hypothetical protein
MAQMCQVTKMTVYRTAKAHSVQILGTKKNASLDRKEYKRKLNPVDVQTLLSQGIVK